MFQSIVISADSELSDRLVSALDATGHVTVARRMDHYPTAIELTRSLRAHGAEIAFIDFQSIEKAVEALELIRKEASHVQIVAFHRQMDVTVLRESMRAGVREFLTLPFERNTVVDSLAHIKALLDRRPAVYQTTNHVYSFLPSKAGVGTSTIAANVSAALARRPDTRVLLTDFDMNSGMLRFMLDLRNGFSVTDAVEHALDMDENLWPQLVTNIESMDVLHAGRINPNLRIEPTQIRHLVAFMRRNYQALCFDLSGNLEKYSIELMQESNRILLICTPEIPSLHLAREKVAFLKEFDLAHRVAVVLNRVSKKKPLFTEKQVEELVGVPVIRTFPNDYLAVQRSVASATLVTATSRLGKAFTEFASILTGQRAPAPEASKHKFLEYFAPVRPTPSPRLGTD